MAKGFVYLTVVLDWHTRRVLSHRVSNTMDVSFCLDTVAEAIRKYGTPDIMNTDQGSQFTGDGFIGLLKDNEIEISMDGKGSWRDNVFVERLWRSVKYEEVYLHAYASIKEARNGIGKYLQFYNSRRPHSSLGGQVPDQVYFNGPLLKQPNGCCFATYKQVFIVQTIQATSLFNKIDSFKQSEKLSLPQE